MTEREADDLAEKIGRHVRFKVTGRRTVAGKGIHLQVSDLQTGFKHTIHSAEHWRQVFNEMVLLVEGAWEDVTLAAISQLEREERRYAVSDMASAQRRNLLTRQKVALLRALDLVAAESLQAAVFGEALRQHRPPGAGSIRQRSADHWEGLIRRPGTAEQMRVSARTYEECEQKLAEIRGGGLPVQLGVSRQLQSGWIRRDRGSFRGHIKWEGKEYSVSATSYERCAERLEELRACLREGRTMPRAPGTSLETRGGVYRNRSGFQGAFRWKGKVHNVYGRTEAECWAKLDALKARLRSEQEQAA